MRKLGNTFFIFTQGAYVSRDGENIVVSHERKELKRIPIHTLEGVVCFGDVLCTPFALGLCVERGVHVSMLTQTGNFLARVSGKQTGNVLLRRAQHRATSDPTTALEIAKSFVVGKIANCRTTLQRALRDHADKIDAASVQAGVDKLAQSLRAIPRVESLDGLRGIEGDAAKAYFNAFDSLILTQKKDFFMRERSRRPPLDRVNSLLSFLYTILVHKVVGACETVGLDPQMGFLHADRPGRPSLALDLMEEFRPWLADRLALTLINRNQLDAKDFTFAEGGAVTISDDAKKTILKEWQEKNMSEATHPFTEEKAEIGLFPFVQAQLLARRLRGDLDAYPPMLMK